MLFRSAVLIGSSKSDPLHSFGGVLLAHPIELSVALQVPADGTVALRGLGRAGAGSMYFQAAGADPSLPEGVWLSNAVLVTLPM